MASEGASRVMTFLCSPSPLFRAIGRGGGLTLKELVSEDPLQVTEVLSVLPEVVIDTLKEELQHLLSGGSEKRSEFTTLQKLVAKRLPDLTANILLGINRSQLEILVAIRTGIQGFLHPDITITQGVLAQIFLQKRCRNIACQAPLPANDCACKACSSDSGFCNMCMCISCFTFDFEANTCRWVGCDFCLHWCHSDCALHLGDVGITTSRSSRLSGGGEDLHYLCPGCGHASELFGFVSDVFQNCAGAWKKDNLARELACVERMFEHSTDPRGQRLSTWAHKLQMHLDAGVSYVQACKHMQRFFFENMTVSPQEISTGLNISLGPGHDTELDDPKACDGSKAAVPREWVTTVSGGTASQSEAASNPVCRRNNQDKKCDVILADDSFPVSAHRSAGPATGKRVSGDVHGSTQRGNHLPMCGLFSEPCKRGVSEGELHQESHDNEKGEGGGLIEIWQGCQGFGRESPADMAEMGRPWRVNAGMFGRGRGRLAGDDVLAWTSGGRTPGSSIRMGERREGVRVAVGMRYQERALKRSRSMIDACRDNLAELQEIVTELHRETELGKKAILDLEQQIVSKELEHHDLQKKADGVRREVEALRATLQERQEVLSLKFNEQYAHVDCEAAKIRCSSIRSAVQILAGSQQVLDDAETEVMECLRSLIHNGKKPREELLPTQGMGAGSSKGTGSGARRLV